MHRSLIAKKNQQKRDNIMHISSAVFFFVLTLRTEIRVRPWLQEKQKTRYRKQYIARRLVHEKKPENILNII